MPIYKTEWWLYQLEQSLKMERSWKYSSDCSGYVMDQSGIAFERKAGLKLDTSDMVLLLKNPILYN